MATSTSDCRGRSDSDDASIEPPTRGAQRAGSSTTQGRAARFAHHDSCPVLYEGCCCCPRVDHWRFSFLLLRAGHLSGTHAASLPDGPTLPTHRPPNGNDSAGQARQRFAGLHAAAIEWEVRTPDGRRLPHRRGPRERRTLAKTVRKFAAEPHHCRTFLLFLGPVAELRIRFSTALAAARAASIVATGLCSGLLKTGKASLSCWSSHCMMASAIWRSGRRRC